MPEPAPIALSDAQVTTIMQLSRPLLPDQRIAFVELLTAKLNGQHEIGDGELHRLCRDLIKEHRLFDPPLSTAGPQRSRGNRTSAVEAVE
jgi:hypothetical protein